MPHRVIFVCDGNIERSVVAEFLFRRFVEEHGIQNVTVDSFGIFGDNGDDPPELPHLHNYPPEYNAARPVLEELGLDISSHAAQRVELDEMKQASVVVAMHSHIAHVLRGRFPTEKEKVRVCGGDDGIPDGYGSEDEAFHRQIIFGIAQAVERQAEAWVK